MQALLYSLIQGLACSRSVMQYKRMKKCISDVCVCESLLDTQPRKATECRLPLSLILGLACAAFVACAMYSCAVHVYTEVHIKFMRLESLWDTIKEGKLSSTASRTYPVHACLCMASTLWCAHICRLLMNTRNLLICERFFVGYVACLSRNWNKKLNPPCDAVSTHH